MQYNISRIKQLQKEDVSGNIILAPFNHYSIVAYHILNGGGGRLSFCDNDTAMHVKTYKDAEICGFETAYKNNPDAAVIICSFKHKDAIERQVRNIGFKNIYYLDQIADKNAYNNILASGTIAYEELPPKISDYLSDPSQLDFLHNGFSNDEDLLIIENFNIKVSEKCTLRCRHCSSLMQYYVNPKHQNFTEVLTMLDALLMKVDYIRDVGIIGGEPLIYPDLAAVIRYVGSKAQCGHKEVITNGTVIPTDEVLSALRETNTHVLISDYGDISRRKDEIMKMMADNSVSCIIKEDKEWVICREFTPKMGKEEATEIFNKCSGFCASIMNGKFYYCNFIAGASVLKAIPDDSNDYIDLLSGSVTRQDVYEYLHRKEPLPACYYCSGLTPDGEKIPAGKQADKPLEYKKYYE